MTSESKTFNKQQVAQLLNSVISRIEKKEENAQEQIYSELLSLRHIIEELRREIHASRAGEIGNTHLPEAHDELDAVVLATEEATNIIMDACDAIQTAASSAPPQIADTIVNQVTAIYEACSFQDITGQRIRKVTRTLRDVDEKIAAIIKAISQTVPIDGIENSLPISPEKLGDAALLNGPQLPAKAITQDDIDKLLESFE